MFQDFSFSAYGSWSRGLEERRGRVGQTKGAGQQFTEQRGKLRRREGTQDGCLGISKWRGFYGLAGGLF